jgi:site-specific DNA recombinase
MNLKENAMNVALYTRVSTDEQATNFSLPSQAAAARRYAEERGWTVIAEISDAASGAMLEREGLQRLRALIRERMIGAVVVHALDRLTRNVAHMLLLRDEMAAAGVALHAVTRGESAATPEGRLFDTIESAFGEFERLKIAERMRRGRRAKLESGRVLGGGIPPYGYRWDGAGRDKRLIVEEHEAAWVRRMYEWAAEGVPLRRIVSDLLSGAPPPTTRRPRPAGWARGTVHNILHNPVYKGLYYSKRHNIGVPAPAIVDERLWEVVQVRLRLNKEEARRNAKRCYPLRGRLYCPEGHALRIRMQGSARRRWYRCGMAEDRALDRPNGCPCRRMHDADMLETLIWRWVTERILSPDALAQALERAEQETARRRDAALGERAVFAAQAEEAERRAARLVDLYVSGVITLEEVRSYRLQCDAQRAAALREIERIDALLEGQGRKGEERRAVMALAERLRASLETAPPTPEQQAEVYAALGLRAVVNGDIITMSVELTMTEDTVVSRPLKWIGHKNIRTLRISDTIPLPVRRAA